MLKSTLLFTTLFISSTCLSQAQEKSAVSQELNHFFNNIGFVSNVTGGHSYHSQAAGFASMGSVYARNQVRNIQLVHVDAPGFRAGCGGIDLFAGGFSFIKGDQIVKFMQSILSNGGGYAMNLALETELPEIAHAMQYMQKLSSDVNNMNFNSCEMGENAAAALWPKNRAAHQHLCEDIGRNTGIFKDWAEARQGCSTGGKMEEQLTAAKKNPEYKERVLVNTNVVWDALQHNQFIASDKSLNLAEVYMSISGTVVFDNKGALQSYPSLADNQDFIKTMLYGGELPSYRCKDPKTSNCVDIDNSAHISIKNTDGLVSQVQEVLNKIYAHIKEGTALEASESGMIEMTQPAVFSVISAAAQQNIGIQSAYELSQLIATDLLAQYLSNALQVIRASLAAKDIGTTNEEKLFKSIQVAQKFVDNFNADSRSRFNAALLTNQLANANVQQALSTLSPMLKKAYNGEV